VDISRKAWLYPVGIGYCEMQRGDISMSRKRYQKRLNENVHAFQTAGKKMVRFGAGPPSREELGEVFEHVYSGIESDSAGPIARAFNEYELDLANPFHWAHLLEILCDLHFNKKPRKRKLDEAFHRQLATDRALVKQNQPEFTQLEQAAYLRRKFPQRYGDYKSAESLRRVFSAKTSHRA
jgi:hypothetical protein